MQRSRVKSGGPEWYFVDDSQPARETWFSRNKLLCRVVVFLAIVLTLLLVVYARQVFPGQSQYMLTETSQTFSRKVIPDHQTPIDSKPNTQNQNVTEEIRDEDVAGPVVPDKKSQQQEQ